MSWSLRPAGRRSLRISTSTSTRPPSASLRLHVAVVAEELQALEEQSIARHRRDCRERRARPPVSSPRTSLRAQHLLALGDGVDHDHHEEVLEVALEQLHQRLAQLGTGVARARLQRRDVVLGDPEAARKLALREVMTVAHGAQSDGPDLDVHKPPKGMTKRWFCQRGMAALRAVQAGRVDWRRVPRVPEAPRDPRRTVRPMRELRQERPDRLPFPAGPGRGGDRPGGAGRRTVAARAPSEVARADRRLRGPPAPRPTSGLHELELVTARDRLESIRVAPDLATRADEALAALRAAPSAPRRPGSGRASAVEQLPPR